MVMVFKSQIKDISNYNFPAQFRSRCVKVPLALASLSFDPNIPSIFFIIASVIMSSIPQLTAEDKEVLMFMQQHQLVSLLKQESVKACLPICVKKGLVAAKDDACMKNCALRYLNARTLIRANIPQGW